MSQSGLRAGRLNPKHTGRIVATERTGKGLKFQKMLSTLALLAGVVMIVTWMITTNNGEKMPPTIMVAGCCLFAVSLPWMIFVRFLTWWRHG